MKPGRYNVFCSRQLALLSLVGLLGFTACQEDGEIGEILSPEEVGYPGVAEELWPFFNRFEDEAQARGITVDLRSANITGVIDELEEHNVLGQCHFNRFRSNEVTIDAVFWSSSNDRGREFVTFHELGHCFLNRTHREDTDRFGLCQSIMRSGTGSCRDNYNQFTRIQYLDELFDTQFAGDIFE